MITCWWEQVRILILSHFMKILFHLISLHVKSVSFHLISCQADLISFWFHKDSVSSWFHVRTRQNQNRIFWFWWSVYFYLFMIFRISFLIIYESDSTACSYSKFFMLLKFICNFSEKKLYYSISAFFYVMRVVYHLKQSLSYIIISEQ